MPVKPEQYHLALGLLNKMLDAVDKMLDLIQSLAAQDCKSQLLPETEENLCAQMPWQVKNPTGSMRKLMPGDFGMLRSCVVDMQKRMETMNKKDSDATAHHR